MTKHGMRGFASGIIVTTAIVGLVYFQSTPKSEATNAQTAPLTEKSVQSYLNSHGEIAVDKKMFDKWQNSEQQSKTAHSKKTDKKASQKPATKATTTAPKVYKATVQVTDGMTTSDVAATLQSEHIIKDKYDLINYVIKNKLEPYLQLGTFTLSSDMTIPQIAQAITQH